MKAADLKAPVAALIAFSVLTIFYHWARPIYDFVLTWWGIEPLQSPFLDTGAIIAAAECFRHGVDVYIANPCDVFGRVHIYSPLWLAASLLPVTSAWTTPVGFMLDLTFLLSLAAISAPADTRGQWMLSAAVLSTMSVYAVERANNDLLVFLLLVFATLLLARSSARDESPAWRWCAYPLILLAAFLKFYPIVGLFVSLRERSRIFLLVTALALFSVFIFAITAGQDVARAIGIIPSGSYFTDWFGARNLPYGITWLIYSPSGEPLIHMLPLALLGILCSRALWISVTLARSETFSDALSGLPERQKLLLVGGAALVTVCFFAGHNVYYRGIFLLMVLPGLLALGRQLGGEDSGRMCSNSAKLILFIMWSEAIRHAIVSVRPLDLPLWHVLEAAFWIARELIWWRIIAVFSGVLAAFALSSPAWHTLAPKHTAMKVETS
jgi:hypothetical protein